MESVISDLAPILSKDIDDTISNKLLDVFNKCVVPKVCNTLSGYDKVVQAGF